MPQLSEPVRSRLRATTSLPVAQVKQIGLAAAATAKGDFWNGRQRVTRTKSTPKADVYEIRDALGTRRLMTFRLVTEVKDGRTQVRLDVEEAVFLKPSRLARIKEPRALAHHTLKQYLAATADAIRAKDADANVKVREDLTP